MNLSPEVEKVIPMDRVHHLYSIRDRRRAQLDEAEKAAKSAHLAAWVPESKALVAALSASLTNDEKRIDAFEKAIAPLEKLIAEQATAQIDFDRANYARGQGSMKRAEALKLRDDVEACGQVLLIRRRATEVSVNAIRVGLPMTSNLPEQPGRGPVESIAMLCLNRRFYPQSSIGSFDPDTYKRWLETPDHELMYWPVHAARVIAESKRDAKERGGDAYREPVVVPIDDFVREFQSLKQSRAAHIRAKVARAAQELETAKTQAAGLAEGAQ
jgi:hypothetical protein